MVEASGGLWSSLSSGIVLSVVAVVWTMLWTNIEGLGLHKSIGRYLKRHARRLAAVVDPYLSVTIAEYDGGRLKRSEAYEQVRAYLQRATCAVDSGVRHLKAEPAMDADGLVLSMDDYEEVADAFGGATVLWMAGSNPPRQDAGRSYSGRAARADRRFYKLYFFESDRDLVLREYLPHVRREGRAVMVKNRQRKLFTNIPNDRFDGDGWTDSAWSHVVFEHPKTFPTLAMDPAKKKEIIDDLDAFRNGKDYYARVGKAWKRGYLLHGPPGTGKSTMIAAMANYLDYDIYDIELTSVRTNSDLRKLFIETTSKSIIVIEDIDCSLDLTGKRKKKKKKTKDDQETAEEDKEDGESKVTLSGVLNFIDGLWSACGGERIIIFTTNHLEKLDPALIRRGRMDMHIHMSYCCYEAFKLLAKVYLGVESHHLFATVASLLPEANMTPADVAEYLTPKSTSDGADSRLPGLVLELEKAKEKVLLAKEGGKGKESAEDDDDDDE